MSRERFHLIPEVSLLLIRDGQVCLLQRQNTGYEDGKHCFIAGHKEAGESAMQAVIREAMEEAGIVVDPACLQCVHVMHRKSDDERICFFFTAPTWQGEPANAEPEKCSTMGWFPVDAPPETMIPYMREALRHVRAGRTYSEFGWE